MSSKASKTAAGKKTGSADKTAGRGQSRPQSKRAAAAAAAAAEEEEDPDDPMQENVLYEVLSIIGKRRQAGRLEYEVQWSGFPRSTWEPAANLVSCQPLVDRFNADTAAEEAALMQQAGTTSGSKAHKPAATHSPQSKRGAEPAEEAPSSQVSASSGGKGAGADAGAAVPHGHKRERKKVEHFQPLEPSLERALRQEEHISKLTESKSKKQKTSKGGAAEKGQGEEDEYVEGEDVFEIQSIVGKKKEGGTTFFLCRWAPSGGKVWDDTYEPEANIFAKELINEFNERSTKGKRRRTAGAAAAAGATEAAGASAEGKSIESGSEISPSQPSPSQPSQSSQAAQPAQTAAAPVTAASAAAPIDESPQVNMGVLSDDEGEVGDVVMVSSTVVTTLEDSPAPEPAALTAAVPAGGDWSDPSEQTGQLAPLPLAPKAGAESLEAPTVTATVTMLPGADVVFVSVQQSDDTAAAAATADTAVEPLASSLTDDPSTLAPSFEATGELSAVLAESKTSPPPLPSSPTVRSSQHHAASPLSSPKHPAPPVGGLRAALSSLVHSVLGGGADEHSESKTQQQEDAAMQ